MDDLIGILGRSVASEGAQVVLANYAPMASEVADLASDEGMAKDYYLFNADAGICIKHEEDGRIIAIFLYSEGHEDYSAFRGALGKGLGFSSTPADVRQVLGAPSFHRAEGPVSVLGVLGEGLQYDGHSHRVNYQFAVGGRTLELVTLMVKSDG